MSARRVMGLTLALPPTSRTMGRLGGEDAAWTPDMLLAGLIVERLDALHYSFIKANGGKARKPGEIVPRPKPEKRAKRAVPTLSLLDGLDRRIAAAAGGG